MDVNNINISTDNSAVSAAYNYNSNAAVKSSSSDFGTILDSTIKDSSVVDTTSSAKSATANSEISSSESQKSSTLNSTKTTNSSAKSATTTIKDDTNGNDSQEESDAINVSSIISPYSLFAVSTLNQTGANVKSASQSAGTLAANIALSSVSGGTDSISSKKSDVTDTLETAKSATTNQKISSKDASSSKTLLSSSASLSQEAKDVSSIKTQATTLKDSDLLSELGGASISSDTLSDSPSVEYSLDKSSGIKSANSGSDQITLLKNFVISNKKEQKISDLTKSDSASTSEIAKNPTNIKVSSVPSVDSVLTSASKIKESSVANSNATIQTTSVDNVLSKNSTDATNIKKSSVARAEIVSNDMINKSADNILSKSSTDTTNIKASSVASAESVPSNIINQNTNATIQTASESILKTNAKASEKSELAKIKTSDENSPKVSSTNKTADTEISSTSAKKKDGQTSNNLGFQSQKITAQSEIISGSTPTLEVSSSKIEVLAIAINEKITDAKAGSANSAQIKVNLDGIGTVFVKIELSESSANIKFESDSKSALSNVENNIGALKEGLEKLGLKTENMNFDFSQTSSDNSENLQKGYSNSKREKDSESNNLSYYSSSDKTNADLQESTITEKNSRIKQGRLIETYV